MTKNCLSSDVNLDQINGPTEKRTVHNYNILGTTYIEIIIEHLTFSEE